ncbi:UNVERIFIED_CONTAM: hypothetical protein NCL1_24828 [Trichonephila clavipes]
MNRNIKVNCNLEKCEKSLQKGDIILKMAPETKEISLDMRTITELHKEGKSFQEIGKILKLSFTTVDYIVKKYLETGSVENKSRPGGPSKVTSVAKRMIVRSATNKLMTSMNIANELLSSCNVSVSAQTVRNGDSKLIVGIERRA